MILALSGRIKAGKSTVANIIQLLIGRDKLQHEHPNTIFENILNPNSINSYSKEELEGMSNWKQVAFAAKLKQIVALLIGCTVEQLEDQEFKSSPLGKEWERWYYKFYKLTTNTRDGRVSPYFNTEEEAKSYEFPKYNFNTPIFKKEYLQLVKEELTPRLLLQLIGTEGLRNLIHPNSHINGLFVDYNPVSKLESFGYISTLEGIPVPDFIKLVYPNWIITDVRFPNDLQAIKERNGIVIRINRNNYPTERDDIKLTQRAETFLSGNIPEHESETALDNAEFDYVIDNNSDIHHLIEEVRKMLIHFKII
jgi:hypothetical protein